VEVKQCQADHAANTVAQTSLSAKTKDTVMTMQTSAATGPSDQTVAVAQPSAVTDTLGVSFARKYLIVMVICAWLASAQVDSCQPPTLIT